MSALAPLLDPHLGPGVRRWDSPLAASYVGGAVRRAGGFFAHLDGGAVDTAAGFHDAVAAALGFPAYYGRNLDALDDCLSDLEDEHPGARVLLWDSSQRLAATEPRVLAVALDLLGSRLTVLLRG